jgi:hypothetical protein
MQQMLYTQKYFVLISLCSALSLAALPIRAADGFDNNYFGSDANQLLVQIDGAPHAVVFGPGTLSDGGYYIRIPQDSARSIGSVSSFYLTEATSSLRSAYLDRVTATTLFYRIYAVGAIPPGWTAFALSTDASLDANQCYATSQANVWTGLFNVDLLTGLADGQYVFEFFLQSDLYDVGSEAPNPCSINASMQCNASELHTERYISSRFRVTDPTACALPALLADLAPPTRLLFSVGTVAAPEVAAAPAKLAFWPNPAVEEIEPGLPETGGIFQLVLWNAAGRRVRTWEVRPGDRLSVADLVPGVYFAALFDEQRRWVAGGKLVR